MDSLLWRCSVPARHLLLARHSAPSFPASTRAFSRWYPRGEISGYDQPKIPVNKERLGKYLKTLHPLDIDGILYVKTVDPYLASYVVENPIFAVVQLAQTTLIRKLGKITMDDILVLKETLNDKIVTIINNVATGWGLNVVRDISPPRGILQAMELEANAERKKQVQILLSKGKAEAILVQSKAVADGIRLLSDAIRNKGCVEAMVLGFTDEYVKGLPQTAALVETEKTTAQFVPEADRGEKVAWQWQGCQGTHDRQHKGRTGGGGRVSSK